MRYTQHPSNNKVIGAPKGWDQKELPCGALPVTVCEEPNTGATMIQSVWMPDEEEIAKLRAGKGVVLTVFGLVHPVVSIGVET